MFAEKLHNELNMKSFFSSNGDPLSVSGSFGVASFPEDAQTATELISLADEAMYLVKASGRNGVRAAGCQAVKGAGSR